MGIAFRYLLVNSNTPTTSCPNTLLVCVYTSGFPEINVAVGSLLSISISPHSKFFPESLTSQELLKAQRDIPIPIIIIPLKHIRHPLQTNTALHKQIKAHIPASTLLVRPIQYPHKRRAQAIPKRHQRIAILVKADIAGAILVKAIEEIAPRRQKSPEAAEFVEVDGTRFVDVEHADHHLHRVRIERCPIAVDERGAELLFRELA